MTKRWGTVAVLIALALTGCGGTSKNATACKLFEDGYNQMTDAVRDKLPSATVTAERDMLPSRIRDAQDKAEGDVSVALRNARDLTPSIGGSDGASFFMAAGTVTEKCKADGVTINLHNTR